MSDASFVAGRGAGKTWALCQWQRQDPDNRVIVVPYAGLRRWTARMLDPGTSPDHQRGVVSVSQVVGGCLRGRPRDTVAAIDEWSLCNLVGGGTEWQDHLHPFPVVAYTDTGHSGKKQVDFLKELGVK